MYYILRKNKFKLWYYYLFTVSGLVGIVSASDRGFIKWKRLDIKK